MESIANLAPVDPAGEVDQSPASDMNMSASAVATSFSEESDTAKDVDISRADGDSQPVYQPSKARVVGAAALQQVGVTGFKPSQGTLCQQNLDSSTEPMRTDGPTNGAPVGGGASDSLYTSRNKHGGENVSDGDGDDNNDDKGHIMVSTSKSGNHKEKIAGTGDIGASGGHGGKVSPKATRPPAGPLRNRPLLEGPGSVGSPLLSKPGQASDSHANIDFDKISKSSPGNEPPDPLPSTQTPPWQGTGNINPNLANLKRNLENASNFRFAKPRHTEKKEKTKKLTLASIMDKLKRGGNGNAGDGPKLPSPVYHARVNLDFLDEPLRSAPVAYPRGAPLGRGSLPPRFDFPLIPLPEAARIQTRIRSGETPDSSHFSDDDDNWTESSSMGSRPASRAASVTRLLDSQIRRLESQNANQNLSLKRKRQASNELSGRRRGE